MTYYEKILEKAPSSPSGYIIRVEQRKTQPVDEKTLEQIKAGCSDFILF